jgi:outer membrane protein
MLKKTALMGLTAAAFTLPAASHADTFLGIYLGAYSWQSSFSGDLGTEGDNNIDIEDDLGFDDSESNTVFYAALEHPVPVLPNIRLQQTSLEVSGDNTGANFDFDGITFSGDISTNVDFSHTDLTLYYEILDNWVSLDIGLTARKFDGSILIADGTNSSEVTLDATIPLGYLKAQFDLPFTGLSAGVDGNFIGYSGNTISDVNAMINYEATFGLGVAVGYRTFGLELDDIDDLNTELTFDGYYAAVTYHF